MLKIWKDNEKKEVIFIFGKDILKVFRSIWCFNLCNPKIKRDGCIYYQAIIYLNKMLWASCIHCYFNCYLQRAQIWSKSSCRWWCLSLLHWWSLLQYFYWGKYLIQTSFITNNLMPKYHTCLSYIENICKDFLITESQSKTNARLVISKWRSRDTGQLLCCFLKHVFIIQTYCRRHQAQWPESEKILKYKVRSKISWILLDTMF